MERSVHRGVQGRKIWGVVALLAIGACGDDTGEPDDNGIAGSDSSEAGDPGATPEASTPVLRLDITREGDAVSIRAIGLRWVDDASALPTPMAAGDYAVVGYGRGAVLEAAYLGFPTLADVEPSEGEVGEVIDLSGEVVTATIFLSELDGLDAIEVLAADGEVLATVDADALPDPEMTPRIAQLPGAALSHIDVLQPGDEAMLPAPLAARGTLVAPTEAQLTVLQDALSRSTAPVRNAVATIAFVKPNKAGWLGVAWGNALIIDSTRATDDNLRAVVVHEAAHCYTFLLDYQKGAPAASAFAWDDALDAAAAKRLREFGVSPESLALKRLWESLQDSAVSVKLAVGYQGDAWPKVADAQVIPSGFASKYSSANAREDIADLVEGVQARDWTDTVPAAFCDELKVADALTPRLALAFAKLTILRELDFVDSTRVDDCIGDFSAVPAEADGFSLVRADGTQVVIADDVVAGTLDEDGTEMLAMLAENGPYGALLQVKRRGGTGLGLHRLDTITFGRRDAEGLEAFYLAHFEDGLKARASDSGLVLITEASPDRVQGVILWLNLRNAIGTITDRFSWGSFRYTPG